MLPDIKASKRQDPKPFSAAGGSAAFTAAAGEGEAKKLPRFQGRGYTGAPMTPEGWWTPVVIDLTGVKTKQQVPALRQHDHEQIAGHSETVTVSADGIDFEGVFSGQPEHVAKVLEPGLNGFPWQMSVGATPLRTEFLETGEKTTVNGREVTGPLVISRETEIGEVSFVPLGADGDTSATVSASRGRAGTVTDKQKLKFLRDDMKNLRAAKYSDADVDAMSDDEAKAALKECMKNSDDEPKEKDGDEAKAKAAADARLQARRKAEADEDRRCDAIRAACKSHGVTHITLENGQKINLAAHAIEAGWSAEKAELHALRAGRPTAGGPTLHIPNAPEMSEAVLECAVFQAASPTDFRLFDDSFYTAEGVKGRGAVPAHLTARVKRELAARYPDKVQQAAHDLFKGRITLQRLVANCARANGHAARDVDWSGSDGADVLRAAAGAHPNHIRADGASNYSLSNLLANVLGKSMLSGYLFVEGAWREVAGVRSVTDFKQVRGINLFGTDIMYDEVGPTGELKNASLSDQAFTNQVGQFGKIMTIDRKAFVNDDLGALTTVPMLLGRGAALRLNQNFWARLLSPGNDDGGSTAFFAATHTITGQSANSNLLTGGASALSSTSLQLAKALFDKQVDPAGYPLGVEAEILLYPPELDQTAWELLNSQFIVAGGGSSVNRQPSENRWRGKYKPVMSRYLSAAALAGNSATAWYLLANPGFMPVIECAFLNGVDTPTVQQAGIDFQFDRLGASVRGVFDFGTNMQNFRGGVKSNGA